MSWLVKKQGARATRKLKSLRRGSVTLIFNLLYHVTKACYNLARPNGSDWGTSQIFENYLQYGEYVWQQIKCRNKWTAEPMLHDVCLTLDRLFNMFSLPHYFFSSSSKRQIYFNFPFFQPPSLPSSTPSFSRTTTYAFCTTFCQQSKLRFICYLFALTIMSVRFDFLKSDSELNCSLSIAYMYSIYAYICSPTDP